MKEYKSLLTMYETQKGIEKLKNYFQQALSYELNLTRVSAPLFVLSETGFNDDLNGTEKAVDFTVCGKTAEIVHSLAKWKRHALKKYDFTLHSGLYTDMNAVRKDETEDCIHSYYVDQWDWEYIIKEKERTDEKLEIIVQKIYNAILNTEKYIVEEFPKLNRVLPEKIHFITTQELYDMYPDSSPKERENAICKEYGAVFLKQIGKKLTNNSSHDGRSPDYDDWDLNGDLLVWYEELNMALELSSMGIRVDKDKLLKQLELSGQVQRLEKEYHQLIVKGILPFTIGGGIGQSRLAMFFLKKLHIGEVQVSIWSEKTKNECEKIGIELL